MAWLAIDLDNDEYIFDNKPYLDEQYQVYTDADEDYGLQDTSIQLPEGMIEKMLGRKLTFEDGPVEI